MRSNGSTGFKELLVGSNTKKIVLTSEKPVLVIKTEHKTFKVNDFVFVSSFKNESKISYKKAIKFTKALGAKIHLLMVNTPSKFMTYAKANDRMKNFAKDFDFSKYTTNIYNDLNIEKGIMNFSSLQVPI